jgi:hypothetical protein
MASGALVLSILGYISGWTEARSYFETLGALWAASMLSPLRLLQLSTDLISATAFTAIVSIRWAATDAKNAMRVANASLYGLFVGFALGAIPSLPGNWLPAGTGYRVTHAASVILAADIGLMVGPFARSLSSSGLKWSGLHVGLLVTFFVIGLLIAPAEHGYARALRDEKLEQLPRVQLGTDDGRDWRLLEVIDHSALLMSRGASHDRAAFRVIAITDVKVIAAAPTK